MSEPCDRPDPSAGPAGLDRRRFLTLASALGVALPALAAEEKASGVSARALAEAEKLVGLEFTPPERELMLEGLEDQREDYEKIRKVPIDNSVPPALRFDLPDRCHPLVAAISGTLSPHPPRGPFAPSAAPPLRRAAEAAEPRRRSSA